MATTTPKRSLLVPVLCTAGLLIGFLSFFSARWFVSVYGRLGFDSVLYTLGSDLGGVQGGLVGRYLLGALLPAVACTALGPFLFFFLPGHQGKYQSGASRPVIPAIACPVLSLCLLAFAAWDIELVDYLMDQSAETSLYESDYSDPARTAVEFPGEKRNLIYIMLESMETTYLSKDLGGAMAENLIPELYELAEENLCFSDSQAPVGGYYTTAGATWTIGSMVAQTAGIPLKTPTEDVNKYGAAGEAFLPGVTTLTDLLHSAGYNQALMVGSDANFGGREPYFLQHGMDAVYDVYTARRDGIIPKDYFVWWGMEDLYLFRYAKEKITEMAAGDQPFAFTLLTVDTHHVGGYQCALCQESASGESYDQSISCSSRQVAEFVQWIQNQDFYDNTTVIIVGDHESMDNGYFQRMVDEDYQRMIYNCFLNVPLQPVKTQRQFAAIDLFPTTLAALGCTIEGDRLGLGTNLFSGTPTLIERFGFEKVNDWLSQSSEYYEQNFFE